MATTTSLFLRYLLSVSLLSLCFLKKGYASIETHTIELSSLLPSSVCSSSSTTDNERKSSLKLVHKHGPCSQLHQDKTNSPSHTEILPQDQSRVNSINSRLSKISNTDDIKATDAATLPAKDGSSIGSGNYFVTVGLGTPKKDLSLIFDTGSDLTWTQCQPCVKVCYNQKEPIYDPRVSKTYTNLSCTSASCSSLTSATGNSPSCASSTCVYGIQYGDSSFSVGFFSTETLALTPTDVFPNFLFGCGQNNQGLFGGAAGLIGLGRNAVSLVSQTAKKYNKIFSYCLPSSASSTGFLSFGNGAVSQSVNFTPLSSISQGSSFYGLDITGLSVGGKKLPVSSSVFSAGGAIIDSGTVISRLPPGAYSPLRSAFRSMMTKYPMAPALSILDTCYDLSNYTTVMAPKISFFFNPAVQVDIDFTGIFYVNSPSQVCLAFAGNNDASDITIFGNVQQKTMQVVYDVAGGKVGFAPKGCS